MFWRIILNQARYRWGITALVFLAMASLVTLYVYLLNTTQFTNRSMQLIMKSMGHNMLILPQSANPLDVHLCTDDQPRFSDQVTHRLAGHGELFSRYYVSVLQKRIRVLGVSCLLTGIEPVRRADESAEKGNLIRPVPGGSVRLGTDIAEAMGIAEGDMLTILQQQFRVAKVHPPTGTDDDFRVYMPLPECQALLQEPGQINAIWAFQCLHHGGPLGEIEALQTKMLAEVEPGFRHVSRMNIARGRYLARETTSKTLRYLLGIVFAATVFIIAIAGMQEVAERRREVGIFVAMGTGFHYVVALYLVKLLAIAALASIAGFTIGSKLAVDVTADFLVTQTRAIGIIWSHLPRVMGQACLVALFAMTLPMLQLVRMDPNATLVED